MTLTYIEYDEAYEYVEFETALEEAFQTVTESRARATRRVI